MLYFSDCPLKETEQIINNSVLMRIIADTKVGSSAFALGIYEPDK